MKKTLVIGASPNPDRYSYLATNMLDEYNHEIVAYGIREGYINKHKIETTFPSDTDFDTVTLYINKGIQKEYYDKIIKIKPRRVIFNPGTENAEFESLLNDNHIVTLEACTLVLLRTHQY